MLELMGLIDALTVEPFMIHPTERGNSQPFNATILFRKPFFEKVWFIKFTAKRSVPPDLDLLPLGEIVVMS